MSVSSAERIQDDDRAVNGEGLADTVAALLRDYEVQIPKGRFLGLAAGAARAEMHLAQLLGVSYEDILLVDKTVEHGISGVTYEEADIFSFLENYRNEPFAMVTVFGVEYLFSARDANWQKLWEGLGRITRSGAIVTFYPNIENFELPSGVPFNVLVNKYLVIAQRV